MIFETTRDYAVIVPLMISNLVSFFHFLALATPAHHEVLASQDGIHLPTRNPATVRPAARDSRHASAERNTEGRNDDARSL